MEIILAKRRNVQNKIGLENPREFFIFIRKMKGVASDAQINGVVTAKDFNDFFECL